MTQIYTDNKSVQSEQSVVRIRTSCKEDKCNNTDETDAFVILCNFV